MGRQALQLSPWHAGLAAPRFQRLLSVLGFVGRLLSPRPFGFREAADPRISSASFPSAMGMLHKLLRRTGRWRQSAAVLCSAPVGLHYVVSSSSSIRARAIATASRACKR